ncbi:IS110 family transposase [Flagellimonas halotolerans]|uniref:IS110 family transposase n=1 Tax=Flagellimonas halotolerans TaxID=3112164 RepID=A0ABU6IV25_9FLAO|nr:MULTISPECIES: IS110 family transposase [unclassified Allomuricauda]MEC3967110.1 IS110 family transposase [Muricauda sp. SYSU M86414]MEC4266977.1 IS110 family transposase [Muricauda sp. SYSU M84420]
MQVYGIDLSMEKFDVNYIDKNGKEKQQQVKNQLNGISKFLDKVAEGAVLCAENTGTYGDLLVFLSNQKGIKIALVPGYTIKHSLGLIKGKSDSMDAGRIREYGERFYDRLTFKTYGTETMAELKSLYALRSRLVKARKVLRTGVHSRSKGPMQSISEQRYTDRALSNLDAEVCAVESEIEAIIKADTELHENYGLVTGIKGIGPVIATDLIIKTGNFKNIDTARKAASYAGVCPFPNESGKMVGKPRTSPFADRKLKSLLYMGSKSAVKHNKEYRLYYQKKQMEGKPHYLIMNNVSNKMLRTIYSVVKNKTPYCQDHICLDPREKKITSSTKKVA